MSTISNAYNKLFMHKLFNDCIEDLTLNQFIKNSNVSSVPLKNIDTEDLKKCIWMCSILASSKDEVHIRKAQLFAALVYLQNSENVDIERACFLILSRTGNLTATRLFKHYNTINDNQNSIYNFDSILNLEVGRNWNDKLISIGNDKIVTSKFQKDLWIELNSSKYISISAPTSSGKSFVIKKHIKNQFISKPEYTVLYIVPSRALLNQVGEELRSELDNNEIEIRTAYLNGPNDADSKKKIYILTPERCLRILQEKQIVIDLLFIDEIQNIEDENGRGSLYEYVLKELSLLFLNAQIIAAGPNIKNTSDLFYQIFGVYSVAIETTISPVFQIKTIIRPLKDKKIKISLTTLTNREQNFELQTDTDFSKKFNSSYGDGISSLLDLLTVNQQNIIYSPQTNLVEDWAMKFSRQSDKLMDANENETLQLIDFLQEEIHPKYYLIDCLKKKIAFHHSKLPDIVRKEIEDGFLEGRITNLFCTSTLLEGVNLPANNLIVVSAKKREKNLSAFEFGNLIGRAGRIKDSLYGTIYCVQRQEDDIWAEKYYNNNIEKEVISVSNKALSNFSDFKSEIHKKSNEIKSPSISNTLILLRHKFLNNQNLLKTYLLNKDIPTPECENIISSVSASMGQIKIPQNVSKLNPSIDPLMQNELYSKILADGIETWVITPNSNFRMYITNKDNENLKFAETSLFWQLDAIMKKLDEIFSVNKEAFFKHNISMSTRQMCVYGLRWLDNKSFRKLIEEDLKFYGNHTNPEKRIDPNNNKEVNERINQVIKINTVVVTYVLVKYLKLLNDILENLMSEEDKEKYKFSLALPTMLELGSSEKIVIQLITKGVSRSIALQVFSEYKKVHRYEELDVFTWLKTKQKLNLKPIYNRHLKKMRLLAE